MYIISRRLYTIAAKQRISSTRSVAYHQPQAVYHRGGAAYIINAKRCISSAAGCIPSRRSRVYHQREALYIISRRLYIIAAKPRISSTRSVVYHQPQAVYHRGEAAYIINAQRCISSAAGCISPTRSVASKTVFRKLSQEVRALKTPPSGLRREGGREVPICQFKIIGYRQNLYMSVQLPVCNRSKAKSL